MSDNMIRFDSSDWNSIRDTIQKINEIGCMQVGTTDEGEVIHFSIHVNEGGYETLKTDVFQKNGWIRTNYYDPEDYTIEELYKRDK